MSFDLKKAVSTIAPTLATMLGGPLAGTAVSALAAAFGLDPGKSSEADITNAMQAGGMTPEIAAQVRAADQRHAEALRQQDIDVAKINADHEAAMTASDAADRDSARRREMSVRDVTPPLLAAGITLGFFGVLATLMLTAPPAGSRDVLNIMLGSLGTAWAGVVAYYFGSSAGSARKTALLASGSGSAK